MVAPTQRTNLSQFFGPGVTAFGRQFGAIGGNVRERGTDRALTAEDLNRRLTQRNPTLTGLSQQLGGEDLSAVSQFLNPTLTGEQQGEIGTFARLAQGRGFQGKALSSRINTLNTGFLAGNRVSAFGRAAGIAQERFGQVQQAANPFLQLQEGITGNLESFLQSGQGSNLLGINFQDRAGGDSLFQALSAVGLGGEAFAGLGRATGNFVGRDTPDQFARRNTTVQSALAQFLDPSARAFNQDFARSLGQSQVGREGTQARLQLLAASRQAGGAELSAQIRDRLSQFGQGITDVTAQAGGAQTLLQTQAGQQQILGQDLSRFSSLFTNLGLTPGFSNINTQVQGEIAGGLFSPGQLFGAGAQRNPFG